MNAYIITSDGVSGVVAGKPFTVSVSHVNYQAIVAAIKAGQWNDIDNLVNIAAYVKQEVQEFGNVRVDVDEGVVYYNDEPLHNVVVDRILKMLAEGFNIRPMINFLKRLMQNPSKQTIDRMYDWLEAGNMPITEDGYFIAYKRVQDDYTSFFDGKTRNDIGTWPKMPRYACNDDNTATCSDGLHFCSQSYLPFYYGGNGRVLILKVDPMDVVSIPIEYGTAKGRACQYYILDELHDEQRQQVETDVPVMSQSVVSGTVSSSFVQGYTYGYNLGRRKQCVDSYEFGQWSTAYQDGYIMGHKDGRGHKQRQYK